MHTLIFFLSGGMTYMRRAATGNSFPAGPLPGAGDSGMSSQLSADKETLKGISDES
jgi:hypothetical protein